jgi:hypothetical protein
MPQQWFIRVDGKEYGPADLETLRDWKAEGRVLPTNDARAASSETWAKADHIPGLFGPTPRRPEKPEGIAVRRMAPRHILLETFSIYVRGFLRYLGLTLLVVGPSLCGQLAAALLQGASAAPNPQTLLLGGLALCMLLLGMILTPIYIAGIQILTAAFAAGERISLFAVLNEAVKYWPRVAVLWVFVFLCYFFWTVMPSALIFTIALSGPSVLSFFVVLVILSVMVWITGRLFVNFMFWQQFAVLESCNFLESLRRSRELARSGGHLPRFQRPMWRGVLIASAWFALVLVLNWPIVWHFFGTIWGASDPQKLVEMLRAGTQNGGGATPGIAATVVQAILKPLLGIAFVLLFLDSKLRLDQN